MTAAHRKSLRAQLRETLEEGSAIDLAVLRITVALLLFASTSIASAEHWAALAPAARTVPFGVGWLVPHLPIDPPTVRAVRAIFQVACVLGILGLATRVAFGAIVLTAFYLLLIPQLGGAVFHDHHLLWLAVIMLSSPAGDALSIDAWLARRRGDVVPTHGLAHGLALRAAWMVIGLVFLFPGIHKLVESGWAWALSDNLRNQIWWKWAQDPSLLPSFRIDHHPWLCRALAALTIVFELSFLPLVFFRRTRWLAVLGALSFHAGAELFMGIQFSVLWGCYTMFVPWEASLERLGWKQPPRAEPVRSVASLALTAPLLVLIFTFGAMGRMQAYPFACYPTFQWIAADHMPAMEIEVERGGMRTVLSPALYQEPGPRGWALAWRLIGVYGAFDRQALRAWWDDAATREPLRSSVAGATVHVARVEVSVDPDHSREVISRRALASFAPE